MVKNQTILNHSNLLVLSTPAAVVVMTFLLSRGNALAAIGTGITSFASSAAVVSNLDRRCGYVKDAKKLIEQLPSLEAETQSLLGQRDRCKEALERQENELSNYREQLNHTQGTLAQIQGALTEVKQEIANLSETKAELERRVALIDKQHPDLAYLEQLQKQIEQIRLATSELEGRKETLQSQVNSLEIKQGELQKIETQFLTKQIDLKRLQSTYDALTSEKDNLETYVSQLRPKNEELESQKQQILQVIKRNTNEQQELEQAIARSEQANTEIKEQLQLLGNNLETKKNELQKIEVQLLPKQTELEEAIAQSEQLTSKIKELEKQATELEQLRVTYDTLSAEKNSFETQIDRLRPEIAGLSAQKQQILQVIQQSEDEYRQIEQQRAESHRLRLEIKQKKQEISSLERELKQIAGAIDSSAREKAELEQDNSQLEKRLKRLKGEIEEIENSAALALQALRKPLWDSLPQANRQIDTSPSGEQQFIAEFSQYLTQRGLTFPQRVINAFHTSLKVQDISALVILAGISGTGKSELPQRYGEYVGAQSLTLAVQPRWDSPQDLQGFYNYIEKKYKPTDLMRGLYQYQNSSMSDRLVMVLLDEMNLARVEYYFSDFLSKLETRRSQATYLELDVGSLPLPETERRLAIPKQFLFVGTMNEDETTQSLSDKVLDRANVLTFGKPQQLKLREEASNQGYAAQPPQDYISYSQFQGWMRKPDPNSETVTKLRGYLDRANAIMDKLGHPFAHRVYQAITRYVVNYPGVVQGNNKAFNAALADQFGQKLLPKLRGLMLDECSEELNEFSRLIDEIEDEALIKAFATAKDGHFGQFHWRGFVYLEESENLVAVGG